MVSHLILESIPKIKIEKTSLSWSPVTESNRRPSPYHACRFRLMASRWVRLPQAKRISASENVALRPVLPGAVVTWFVTGRLPDLPSTVCPQRPSPWVRSVQHPPQVGQVLLIPGDRLGDPARLLVGTTGVIAQDEGVVSSVPGTHSKRKVEVLRTSERLMRRVWVTKSRTAAFGASPRDCRLPCSRSAQRCAMRIILIAQACAGWWPWLG